MIPVLLHNNLHIFKKKLHTLNYVFKTVNIFLLSSIKQYTCSALQGKLVEIESSVENKFLKNRIAFLHSNRE